MVSSSKPVPDKGATELEILQYEHAALYEAYKNRGKLCDVLEEQIVTYQKAFGKIDEAMQGVIR